MLLTGCGSPVPAEYEEFFGLPLDQQHEKFRTFPVEQQINIYFAAMGQHPPDNGFADDIAGGGKKALPILLDKLRSADELHQYYLLEVFEIMAKRGDLSSRQDIINEIRNTVSKMKFKQFKEMSQSALVNIENNSIK